MCASCFEGSAVRVLAVFGEVRIAILNVLAARILETPLNAKDECKVQVRLDIGCPLLATITRKSLFHLNLKPGQNIYAHIKAIRMAHELE